MGLFGTETGGDAGTGMTYMAPVMAIANGALSYMAADQTNSANRQMMDAQMNFNRDEAEKNRIWQAEMSNTAYQRAMNDMKLAGLNPMLAYSQGGASSPGGAVASAPGAATYDSPLASAMSSAKAGMMASMEMQQSKENIENTRASTGEKLSNQNVNNEKVVQYYRDQDLTAEQTKLAKAQTEIAETNAKVRKEQSEAEIKKAKIDSKITTVDAALSRVGTVLGGANSAVDLMGKAIKTRGAKQSRGSRRSGTMVIDSETGEVLDER